MMTNHRDKFKTGSSSIGSGQVPVSQLALQEIEEANDAPRYLRIAIIHSVDFLAKCSVRFFQHAHQAAFRDVGIRHEIGQAGDALAVQRQLAYGLAAGGADRKSTRL